MPVPLRVSVWCLKRPQTPVKARGERPGSASQSAAGFYGSVGQGWGVPNPDVSEEEFGDRQEWAGEGGEGAWAAGAVSQLCFPGAGGFEGDPSSVPLPVPGHPTSTCLAVGAIKTLGKKWSHFARLPFSQ